MEKKKQSRAVAGGVQTHFWPLFWRGKPCKSLASHSSVELRVEIQKMAVKSIIDALLCGKYIP